MKATKRCSRCGVEKPVHEFHRGNPELRARPGLPSPRFPDGVQFYCRSCMIAYNAARRSERMANPVYRAIETARLMELRRTRSTARGC